MRVLQWMLVFQLFHCSHGVELMKIVSRSLLSLYDGGVEMEVKEKMVVIGAGFGRTGTESLCAAFTLLGYKTYHGTKALLHGHLPAWNKWYGPEHDDSIFEVLQSEGFNATTDFPASLSYAKFMELYPQAKVVLSLHPRGSEGWAKSFINTLVKLEIIVRRPPFKYLPPFQQYTSITAKVRDMIGIEHTKDSAPTFESLVRAYDTWVAHVKESVPADQLLLHKATDGFEPIIQFLNIETPPKDSLTGELLPYPRVNDTEDLYRQIKVLGFVADWWLVIFPCLLISVILFLRLVFKFLFGRSSNQTKNHAPKSKKN